MPMVGVEQARLVRLLEGVAKGARYDHLIDLLKSKRALENDVEKRTRSKAKSASKQTDLMLLSGQLMEVNSQIERMVTRAI